MSFIDGHHAQFEPRELWQQPLRRLGARVHERACAGERLLLDGRRVRIEKNRSFSRPQSFFRRGANAYVADVGAGEKLRRDCKSILNKLAPFRS